MDKISIIIPCYNVEAFISKCLDSIINQSYQNLEIICVDDGSTDSTLKILENYQNIDKRFKVLHHDNRGVAFSRNKALTICTGKFVTFVDGDDWLDYDCIENTISETYDLTCFSYRRVFKSNIQPRTLNMEGIYRAEILQKRIIGLVGKELMDPSGNNSLVTVCAKIYKIDIIRNNGINFTNTAEIGAGEDALFNIEYLEYCKGEIHIIDKPFYNYVRHNNLSITSLYKPDLFNQWKLLHSKIFRIIENKSDDYHKVYYSRVGLSLIGLGLNEMQSKKSVFKKLKFISNVLNDPLYEKAYKQIEYKYFPIHWKVLFMMAKYKWAPAVLIVFAIMNYLWKQKNK